MNKQTIPPEAGTIITSKMIEQRIFQIRGARVMLDSDLAELYEVETGALVRQLKRNIDRFPKDFCFQLTDQEFSDLKCQIGIARSWGGRRSAPYAFTEQGVAMLSSVLRSKRAVHVNITIMRTFVQLRQLLSSNKELARRATTTSTRSWTRFAIVFEAIRELMAPPPEPKKRRIGFRMGDD